MGRQGSGVNGRMQLPDLFPAFFVAADDIHERAIFVEEGRQRIRIMRVPCAGVVCHKLIRNLVHARMLTPGG
jgi:hypothetical protein